MKKSENNDITANKKFKDKYIKIEELKKETESNQYNLVKTILEEAYKDTEIQDTWINSCIDLTNNEHNQTVYLPCNLIVQKQDGMLSFYYDNRRPIIILLLLFIAIFIALAMFATHFILEYIDSNNFDKDIDGDNVADLNIDINGDKIGDINVDIDGDGKPDLNIDYKGNRRAVFNIDADGDGKPDYNMVHDASSREKRKTCSLNCDVNGNGWPDTNVDLDGDGVPDVDIDTDKDGIPDLNIDTNGDGKPDRVVDENNDGVCDKNCLKPGETPKDIDKNAKHSGPSGNKEHNKHDHKHSSTSDAASENDNISSSSSEGGTSRPEINSGSLVITYENSTPSINIIPDDMEGYKNINDYVFTIKNETDYYLKYHLIWTSVTNDFLTDNLQYKLSATNGGAEISDFRPVPKGNETINTVEISIAPRSTQKYTMSLKLKGTHSPQNEDMNKTFAGVVTAEFSGQQ